MIRNVIFYVLFFFVLTQKISDEKGPFENTTTGQPNYPPYYEK